MTRAGPIYVIGDLALDRVYLEPRGTTTPTHLHATLAGGVASNGARAFASGGIDVCLLGQIGQDEAGRQLEAKIREIGAPYFLLRTERPTGECRIICYEGAVEPVRLDRLSARSAGALGAADAEKLLDESAAVAGSLVYTTCHVIDRFPPREVEKYFSAFKLRDMEVILDIVPHDCLSGQGAEIFKNSVVPFANVSMMISNMATLRHLLKMSPTAAQPTEEEVSAVLRICPCRYLIVRYGELNQSCEDIYYSTGKGVQLIARDMDTGFKELSSIQRRGFGDRRLAPILKRTLLSSGRVSE